MAFNSRFLEKLVANLDRMDTDSVQAQFLRLAQEKGVMETIFHALQEGILLLDHEGRIQYANRATQQLLGINPDDAEGQPIQKYLQEIDWDLISEFDEEAWSRLIRREIEITYPAQKFIEFYVAPIDASSDGDRGIVMILRDVTRDREQAADTIESERLNAIMLLAAGVAHEIGNPLNSLNIHLQLLERELGEIQDKELQDDLTELVQIAQNEIARLDQIITQFLGALRPTIPNLERAKPDELIQEVLTLLHHELDDRGVWVEVDIPDDLPPVQLDTAQIKQAVFNILRNSVQALADGGIIKIHAKAEDRFIAIAFSDNGPGISQEVLTHLFEPYHTTKQEGTGLGLMIVQRIVRDHGGLIEIDTQPGQGTTFTLLLPREDQRIRMLESSVGEKETSAS